MKVADRPHRIVIERFTTTYNEYNEEIQAWTAHATLMAQVRFGRGDERREAAMNQAKQTVTFVVVWSPLVDDLRTTDRIVWKGKTWDIRSNAPSLELHKHNELTAVAAV